MNIVPLIYLNNEESQGKVDKGIIYGIICNYAKRGKLVHIGMQ